MKQLSATLVSLALVLGACGGGSDDEPAASTVPPEALNLSQYLVEILLLEVASIEESGQPPNDARLMAGYNLDIANRYRTTLDVLDRIAPPAEAAAHAAGYRAQAVEGVDVFTAAAEAWLDGEGIDELQTRMLAIAEGAVDLGAEFERLVLKALRSSDDPLSEYLVIGIDLRKQFSTTYTEEIETLQPLLASAEPAAIASALESGAASFHSFAAEWDALSVPADARGTHDLQAALVATIADIFTEMAVPVAAGDEPETQMIAERMADFVADVSRTNVSWTKLLIGALGGHATE
jgi:hypothetical protein